MIVVFFIVFGVVIGIVFSIVFGVIRMSLLVHVDGLCGGSKAQILAMRAARLMHGGGIVMGVWGFWAVDGHEGSCHCHCGCLHHCCHQVIDSLKKWSACVMDPVGCVGGQNGTGFRVWWHCLC